MLRRRRRTRPDTTPPQPRAAPRRANQTDATVALDRWYADPSRRARSAAVRTSKYLRARHEGLLAQEGEGGDGGSGG